MHTCIYAYTHVHTCIKTTHTYMQTNTHTHNSIFQVAPKPLLDLAAPETFR